MEAGRPPLLAVKGLAKLYPGVAALKGVDLSASAGEVHALVGANGAGKSTLMNLISGAQTPSEGEIRLDGEAMNFQSPAAAQEAGIATVYQEFSLVPQLSVARNIYLGREPRGRFGLVDRRRLREQTQALLDHYHLKIDPDADAGSLSVAEQQLVEIARALSFEARILILDEPTAVLSLAEQANLFSIIRELKARGMLVLFVSHHLREVLDIADRVTVLRDGSNVETRGTAGLTIDDLAELMIGRRDAAAAAPSRDRAGKAVAGSGFAITYHAGDIESRMEIGHGEIVGLSGLVGSGRTTFARALAGISTRSARVTAVHEGRTLRLSSPREARRSGIVYLTEDRKRDGLFGALDIVANATASALPALGRGPLRDGGREMKEASAVLTRLRLVASSLRADIVKLSGGNQQKVLIARALLTKPGLLVCDEPTRGVDIGAKAEIHAILRELASDGVAVLVVSSETEELLALAHRIVVMRGRRFVAEMPADQTDESQLLVAASGGAHPNQKDGLRNAS